MKKNHKNQGQLDLFQDVKKSAPSVSNNSEPQNLRGKQVFLNSRQNIYEKILNRKME